METYQVDFEELAKAFPDPAKVPALLQRFAEWLTDKPWGSVGVFYLTREWSDHFIGAEFHYHQFAMFIRLPTGSAVGYWLGDGDLADAPIVVLGSEGEYKILAPDLETLLARIARGAFGEKGPEADFLYAEEDYGDDYEDGDVPNLRGDLQIFLREATGIEDLASLIARPTHPADFNGWVTKATEAYEAWITTHPAMLAMAPILEKYRPVNAEPWQATWISIAWAGDNFEASLTPIGLKPFDEAQQLKPHLAILREEAAAREPGLGLWHSASLKVYQDRLYLIAEYRYESKFQQGKPPAIAFKADQARIPREARRIPSWLAAILAS